MRSLVLLWAALVLAAPTNAALIRVASHVTTFDVSPIGPIDSVIYRPQFEIEPNPPFQLVVGDFFNDPSRGPQVGFLKPTDLFRTIPISIVASWPMEPCPSCIMRLGVDTHFQTNGPHGLVYSGAIPNFDTARNLDWIPATSGMLQRFDFTLLALGMSVTWREEFWAETEIGLPEPTAFALFGVGWCMAGLYRIKRPNPPS